MKRAEKIWITWEKQRRSLELAKVLGCDLYVFHETGKLRYPICIYKTLKVLLFSKAKIVFVQNPSMVLATLASLFKFITKNQLIVDRHTTFPIKKKKISLYRVIRLLLNKFTLRTADITIVTNGYLAEVVENYKGNPYVLPDKLPEINKSEDIEMKKGFNIFMISSFGQDEPIKEAIGAVHDLKDRNVNLYISGNTKKLNENIKNCAGDNIVFTDFLNDQDFLNYLYSADAVMVLTMAEYCMLCGCYEAVAAEKPLITSDTDVLRNYFNGSVFVHNTLVDIYKGIIEIMDNYENFLNETKYMKQKIHNEWYEKFRNLEKIINDMH